MSDIIEDGKGTGHKAQVDKNNRLHTRAVTAEEVKAATIDGNAYIISTGIVNVTNDTANYLLYMKNDSEMDLVLERTLLITGPSTGGANNEVTFLGQLNPTAGTLLSSGTEFPPFNLNLGSANIFDGTAITALGVLGLTATGGQSAPGLIHDAGRHEFKNTFILPRGASIAGGVQAASGNTDINVSIAYTVYFRDKDIV